MNSNYICILLFELKFVSRKWVLGDDHYKLMPRVTASVASLRTLSAPWLYMPSIGQNLQPLTGKKVTSPNE